MQLELDLYPFNESMVKGYYDGDYHSWHRYLMGVEKRYDIKDVAWSMAPVDMEKEGYTNLTHIWDTDEDLNRHEVALEGTRPIDIMIAFAKLVKMTGDYHHMFLEGLSDSGEVWTGS